jgi:hypothetical protein
MQWQPKKETEDPPVVFEQLHLFCNGIIAQI